MSRSARRPLGLGLALASALAYAGCASAGSEGVSSRPTNSDAGSLDAGAGGDASAAASSGKGGTSTINTDPGAGAAGVPDGACAAELYPPVQVPLDMYVLLDVSGSMNDSTSMLDAMGNPITKWSAIKKALEAFISADTSSGLNVGIQFFPLLKDNVPAVCSTNADCGDAAPCAFAYCLNTGGVCATQADCPGSALFNPCEPVYTCGDYLCDFPGRKCENGVLCALPTTSTCGHTARCDVASYAVPTISVSPLPGVAPAIISAIEAHTPVDGSATPTGPALTGVIQEAALSAKAHHDHRVVVVLATDGLPTECTPTSIADVAKIASAAFAGAPSVNTFTIGVFAPAEQAEGQAALDKIAVGGGTKAAFVASTNGDVVSEFRDGLDAIRTGQLACEFEIPQPSAARSIDYSLVNLNYKSGGKNRSLFYVASADQCDPLTGGWYYDTDPAVSDPSRIEVCPTTCSIFQGTDNASVQIAVGCQTIVK